MGGIDQGPGILSLRLLRTDRHGKNYASRQSGPRCSYCEVVRICPNHPEDIREKDTLKRAVFACMLGMSWARYCQRVV